MTPSLGDGTPEDFLGLFDDDGDLPLTGGASDPGVSTTARPNVPSDPDALPLSERARLLALTKRQLDLLPNPSRARDLALAIGRELQFGALGSCGGTTLGQHR